MTGRGYGTSGSEDQQMRLIRLQIAERYHWTLEYVDNLDYRDYADIVGVMDGEGKLREAEG